MPNPHFDVQVISRGGGRSAVASASYRSGTKITAKPSRVSVVASASYRSGERLYDVQADKSFDYTRKEDVQHKEILVPAEAPSWATDRETLWNQVEAGEKRKDAQLARDIIAALPRELDTDQHIALVREFVIENFVAQGMIADIAIHDKPASDGGNNPHAHIMLTMREIDSEGFGKKNREWNQPDRVSAWRHSWETLTNRYLETTGKEERVSLQSYAAQGIDQTPQKHVGYEAWHLEEKGIETQKGDQNRRAHHTNIMRDILREPPPPEPANSVHEETALDLKQVGLALKSESEPLSPAADLRQVVQNLTDNEGTATATTESVDAWQQHRDTLTSIMTNTLQRTLQASGEMIQRIGLAARTFREWVGTWRENEQTEPASSPSHEPWTERIRHWKQDKEHTYEW